MFVIQKTVSSFEKNYYLYLYERNSLICIYQDRRGNYTSKIDSKNPKKILYLLGLQDIFLKRTLEEIPSNINISNVAVSIEEFDGIVGRLSQDSSREAEIERILKVYL